MPRGPRETRSKVARDSRNPKFSTRHDDSGYEREEGSDLATSERLPVAYETRRSYGVPCIIPGSRVSYAFAL